MCGDKAIYLDLENPANQRRLDDPVAYLRAQRGRLVILDEIHRAPEIFTVLRSEIDARRRAEEKAGQFLILRSAALTCVTVITCSSSHLLPLGDRLSDGYLAPFALPGNEDGRQHQKQYHPGGQ